MKTRIEQLILTTTGLGISSLAAAHGKGDTPGAAIYHYLTSPDHVALAGLVAMAAGCLLMRHKRPPQPQQQD